MIFHLNEKENPANLLYRYRDLKTCAKSRENSKTYISHEFIARVNMYSLHFDLQGLEDFTCLTMFFLSILSTLV